MARRHVVVKRLFDRLQILCSCSKGDLFRYIADGDGSVLVCSNCGEEHRLADIVRALYDVRSK